VWTDGRRATSDKRRAPTPARPRAWTSCKLHILIGSRRRDAIASAAARAPLIAVMHGIRCASAERRIAFPSIYKTLYSGNGR
jgi:hypothetical protein